MFARYDDRNARITLHITVTAQDFITVAAAYTMGHTVQPSVAKESQFAFYLLMSMLGTSFLAIFVWLVLSYFE